MRQTKENIDLVKKRIIDEAVNEFTIHGFACANLQRIAQSVGISRRPLYYHYQNKNDLYLAAAEWIILQERTAVNAILDESKPILTLLSDDLSYCLGGSRLRPFLSHIGSEAPTIASLDEYYQWLYQRKTHVLTLAKARGELREDCNIQDLLSFLYVYYWGVCTANTKQGSKGFPLNGEAITNSVEYFLKLVKYQYIP